MAFHISISEGEERKEGQSEWALRGKKSQKMTRKSQNLQKQEKEGRSRSSAQYSTLCVCKVISQTLLHFHTFEDETWVCSQWARNFFDGLCIHVVHVRWSAFTAGSLSFLACKIASYLLKYGKERPSQ